MDTVLLPTRVLLTNPDFHQDTATLDEEAPTLQFKFKYLGQG